MAEYTDEQWDTVLGNARNSGVWSIEDTSILKGLLSSTYTFGLHFLKEILDIRAVLVEALVASPMLSDEEVRKIGDFKGQIAGVDKMLALVRELAEKEHE